MDDMVRNPPMTYLLLVFKCNPSDSSHRPGRLLGFLIILSSQTTHTSHKLQLPRTANAYQMFVSILFLEVAERYLILYVHSEVSVNRNLNFCGDQMEFWELMGLTWLTAWTSTIKQRNGTTSGPAHHRPQLAYSSGQIGALEIGPASTKCNKAE